MHYPYGEVRKICPTDHGLEEPQADPRKPADVIYKDCSHKRCQVVFYMVLNVKKPRKAAVFLCLCSKSQAILFKRAYVKHEIERLI